MRSAAVLHPRFDGVRFLMLPTTRRPEPAAPGGGGCPARGRQGADGGQTAGLTGGLELQCTAGSDAGGARCALEPPKPRNMLDPAQRVRPPTLSRRRRFNWVDAPATFRAHSRRSRGLRGAGLGGCIRVCNFAPARTGVVEGCHSPKPLIPLSMRGKRRRPESRVPRPRLRPDSGAGTAANHIGGVKSRTDTGHVRTPPVLAPRTQTTSRTSWFTHAAAAVAGATRFRW